MSLDPIVAVLPADEGGCGFYRLREPCRVLQEEGFPVLPDFSIFCEFEDQDVERWVRDGAGRIIGKQSDTITTVARVPFKPPCDVVVLQRPAHRNKIEMIPHLQAWGIAVVVELDDDFEHIDPRNLAWKGLHPKYGPDMNRQASNLRRAVQLADLVTVSTPALAEVYGRWAKVRVLPNYVPAWYLDLGKAKLEARACTQKLGWAGSIATHPGDLEATHGGVSAALTLHPEWAFHVVGTGTGVAKRLNLSTDQERRLTTSLGWVPLHEYPAELGLLDVGVVPLVDSRFNEAKSYLKGLEMAAVGVPFVASPTQQYRWLAARGAGRLARRSRDWRRELGRLLEDADYRLQVASFAHDVAEGLTYEAHATDWYSAWCEALQLRQEAA